MRADQVRCLVLACGNTLRGDDGVGPWLAEWVEENCAADSGVRVLIRQQWTPELAEEISQAASVLFLDCSIESPPGAIRLTAVQPAEPFPDLRHTILDSGVAGSRARALRFHPRNSMLLTVGAGSTELGESFSESATGGTPKGMRAFEIHHQQDDRPTGLAHVTGQLERVCYSPFVCPGNAMRMFPC